MCAEIWFIKILKQLGIMLMWQYKVMPDHFFFPWHTPNLIREKNCSKLWVDLLRWSIYLIRAHRHSILCVVAFQQFLKLLLPWLAKSGFRQPLPELDHSCHKKLLYEQLFRITYTTYTNLDLRQSKILTMKLLGNVRAPVSLLTKNCFQSLNLFWIARK
jgi:hypothetical protein